MQAGDLITRETFAEGFPSPPVATAQEAQETDIRWDLSEECSLTVWTANWRFARKLFKLGWPVRVWAMSEGKPRVWEVQGMSPKFLVFRSPALDEERRAARKLRAQERWDAMTPEEQVAESEKRDRRLAVMYAARDRKRSTE